MKGFMSRHKDLSLRKPENTSIFRSTAFNKDRVNEFFDNYVRVLEKYNFTGDKIFNLDETGVSTVLRSVKVVSTKGRKQVGQMASGERGELVTFIGLVSAIGGTLPPVFIFPRIKNPEQYLGDGPEGSLVLGNKSGWMNSELFPVVLKHIVKHTHCSLDNRVLLMIDNHESHTSVEAIKFCRENGITLLSFPPHTTHRMQPLDVGIYGPFKNALSVAFNDWLLSHPGRIITIRNIGHLVNDAYKSVFTIKNITSSFAKPGIWPLNRLVFSDNDFIASNVTNNAPLDNMERHETDKSNILLERTNIADDETPTTSYDRNLKTIGPSIPTERQNTSLEEIRPLPKLQVQKKKLKRKYESKSRVFTFTPEYNEKEHYENERNRKKEMKNKKHKVKRQVFKEKKDNCNSENSLSTFSCSDDDNTEEGLLDNFEDAEQIVRDPHVGEFVLVQFRKNNKNIYYIAKVIKKTAKSEFEVLFYRKSLKRNNCFVQPVVEDISAIVSKDIKMILPEPVQTGKTKRQQGFLSFGLRFDSIDIR